MVPLRRLLSGAFALALSLALPQAVFAQNEKPAQDAKSYVWTFKFKKGDAARNKTKIRMNGILANNVEVSILFDLVDKQTVTDITTAGDIVLSTISESVEASVNGKPAPSGKPDNTPFISVLSRSGVLLKRKSKPNPLTEQYETLQTVARSYPAPKKPVKVGESWETELDNPLLPGKKVTLISILTGVEKIKGADCLAIDVQASVPTPGENGEKEDIKVTGTYYLDLKAINVVSGKSALLHVPVKLKDETVYFDIDGELQSTPIVAETPPQPAPVKPKKDGA